MQTTHVYRIFPPQVVSNSHDFEVRHVIHHGRGMRGVFARHPITSNQCSLYMGAYPGVRVQLEEAYRKADAYAARFGVDRGTAAQRTIGYALSLRNHDPGYILDPTDDLGNLLPQFASHLVCYINEPPPGCPAKAVFVYNQLHERYEIWLLHPVDEGEEIFIYYGSSYRRDYPVNHQSGDEKKSHYIPRASRFHLDPRGLPPPLQVPGEGEGSVFSMNYSQKEIENG